MAGRVAPGDRSVAVPVARRVRSVAVPAVPAAPRPVAVVVGPLVVDGRAHPVAVVPRAVPVDAPERGGRVSGGAPRWATGPTPLRRDWVATR